MYKYSFEEIKAKVQKSLSILSINDSFLLKNNVAERAIAHKLGEYLQNLFPYYTVDCEYNRHGQNKKILSDKKVYPDIIIHERGNNKNNLLVIEIKKDINEDINDFKKLSEFTRSGNDYKYHYGLFIHLNVDSAAKSLLRWFENGHEIK